MVAWWLSSGVATTAPWSPCACGPDGGSIEILPVIGTRHVYSASSRYILAYIGLSPETSATGLPGNYYNMFPVLFFLGETKNLLPSKATIPLGI